MDFRIKPTVMAALLAEIGYSEGTYDLVSVAGAGKDLLSPDSGASEFLLKQITLSVKLHHTQEVVILYHDNCGAYGITDASLEYTTECCDLKGIASLLAEKFPTLGTRTFIVKGTASGELKLEEVESDELGNHAVA
jgi:hypothetical protein